MVLIGAVVAAWIYFTQKNNQSEPKKSETVDLKKDNTYPRVETFKVPILMYHYIRIAPADDELGVNLSVTPKNFAAQMKWLKDHDFETVKLSDIADTQRIAISKVYGEGGRPVVITFDDGYTDAYDNAYPVLREFGFSADFFVITDFTDKKNEYMTSDQINTLKKAGMEIGSHTLDHLDLANLDADEAWRQISLSKDDNVIFCYPSGKYNTAVKSQVIEAGYVAAVTTKSGIATEETPLFDLPRLRIHDISAEAFGKIIENALEWLK